MFLMSIIITSCDHWSEAAWRNKSLSRFIDHETHVMGSFDCERLADVFSTRTENRGGSNGCENCSIIKFIFSSFFFPKCKKDNCRRNLCTQERVIGNNRLRDGGMDWRNIITEIRCNIHACNHWGYIDEEIDRRTNE